MHALISTPSVLRCTHTHVLLLSYSLVYDKAGVHQPRVLVGSFQDIGCNTSNHAFCSRFSAFLAAYCKSFLASLLETYHSTLLRSLCSSGQGCISLTFYKRALVCHGHITNPPCPASYCGLTKNNISHLEKHTFLSRKSDKPTNFPTDTHAFSVMSKRLLNGFQRS